MFYVPVRFDGHDDVRTLRLHRMSKVELLDTSSGIDQFDLDEWIEAGGMGFGGQEQIELIPASSPKGRAGLGMRIFRMSLPDGGSSSPCAPPGVIAMTAYSTRWRTRFHADGGRCSSVMADTVPH